MPSKHRIINLLTPYGVLVYSASDAEIGTVQIGGNNRGPRVEEYLASVGAKPGNPWCMAFAFWAHKQAAASQGRRTTCPPALGGAARAWIHAERAGLPIFERDSGTLPRMGDVLIWTRDARHRENVLRSDLPDDRRRVRGHAGLCIYSEDNGTIHTIEGNTSPSPGFEADGAGVWRKNTTITDPRLVGWFRPRTR